MTTQPTPEQLAKAQQEAEDYLREKYGAYRGHFAWRELEEAYTTAYLRRCQETEQAIKDGYNAGRKQALEEAIAICNTCLTEFASVASVKAELELLK